MGGGRWEVLGVRSAKNRKRLRFFRLGSQRVSAALCTGVGYEAGETSNPTDIRHVRRVWTSNFHYGLMAAGPPDPPSAIMRTAGFGLRRLDAALLRRGCSADDSRRYRRSARCRVGCPQPTGESGLTRRSLPPAHGRGRAEARPSQRQKQRRPWRVSRGSTFNVDCSMFAPGGLVPPERRVPPQKPRSKSIGRARTSRYGRFSRYSFNSSPSCSTAELSAPAAQGRRGRVAQENPCPVSPIWTAAASGSPRDAAFRRRPLP